MRRTEIDLNSMSKDGQLIYLKYLVKDLGQALQAEEDLTTMIDSKRLTEEA